MKSIPVAAGLHVCEGKVGNERVALLTHKSLRVNTQQSKDQQGCSDMVTENIGCVLQCKDTVPKIRNKNYQK